MAARINPSVLSADFVNLERDFSSISHADLVHIDVMDNHFVPNLTFGLQMVGRMQEISPKPLDVHLMITDVDTHAVRYAELGVHSVTFHAEASTDLVRTAKSLRAAGARAGLAIKPNTSFESISEYLIHFDQLLVMTVEPGFGGQRLIESTLNKVSAARRFLDSERLEIWLQVDGGIDESNIQKVAKHGADTFVAGSAVFREIDRNNKIDQLRTLANDGLKHFHS